MLRIDLDGLEPGLLGPDLLEGAREVARRLAEAGFRTWMVGGAVRDLLLGRPAKDVDLVCAATPDEVEALFPRTVAVGKAFGVVRVLTTRGEFEVATFRSEEGYADGRRPDRVQYASSAEVDATRRDFTCNALYLDPLNGELLDPTGGAADLREGTLATVGDPRARFEEDGLRLVRMARFQSTLGLRPAPGLHDAARAARGRLASVSPERVLDELRKVLAGPAPDVALEVLGACGLWPAALVRLARESGEPDPALEVRVRALRVAGAWRAQDGLALLLDPDPLGDPEPLALRELLEDLPLARSQRARLRELWRRRRGLLTVGEDPAARARLLRGELGLRALELARCWADAAGRDTGALEDLGRWRGSARLEVTPLLTSAELLELGLVPGPRLGETLERLEDAQLRGELLDADAARERVRRWLVEDAGPGPAPRT